MIEEVNSQVEINDEKNEKINLSKIEIDDIFKQVERSKRSQRSLKKGNIRKEVIKKKKKKNSSMCSRSK